MSSLQTIFQLMRADLLERVRSYSFMIVMVLSILAGYLLVPPFGAPYTSFVIGSHRGFYNSPWVGIIYGVVACTWLALFGFYLVKNAVERDARTRVGQIIAGTPISKPAYTFGKWLSNLAVLTLILAVLTIMAPVMQYVRAEDTHIDLVAIVKSIWLMGFPALAFVSALAVLFECVPILRGGLGNIVYFFIWGPVLVGSIGSAFSYGPTSAPRRDFAGISRSIIDIRRELDEQGFHPSDGVTGVVGPVLDYEIKRFVWDGIDWTVEIWLERATWFGASALIALGAAIPFDRFDPARNARAPKRRRRSQRSDGILLGRDSRDERTQQPAGSQPQGLLRVQFEPISPGFGLRGFIGVLGAELKLMLKGLHWAWYLVAVGLVAACLGSPLDIVRNYLLPAAWLWPVLIWSHMGTRERRYGVWQMTFSVPKHALRQLLPMWLSGVLLAVAVGSGAAVRFAATGAWTSLLAWAAGAVFIPALAMFLGVSTNSRRTFEMIYMLLWYMAFNGIAAVDFVGTTQDELTRGNPWVFLVLAPVLVGLSLIGRGISFSSHLSRHLAAFPSLRSDRR